MKLNILTLIAAAAGILASSSAFALPINVLSAVYGTPEVTRTCDAAPAVSTMCTGRGSCVVPIGNQLCGDPDFLVVKKINITYRCGRSVRQTAATSEYTMAQLACQ